MNKIHRDLIDKYCDEMVQNLRIRDIWPKLFEHKIFMSNDVNRSNWENNLDNPETVKKILQTIKTRGPLAFGNLIKIFWSTGHLNLAKKLAEGLGNSPLASMPLNVISTNMLSTINNNNNNQPNSESRLMVVADRDNNRDNFSDENIEADQQQVLQIQVKKATVFLDQSDSCILHYSMRQNTRGLLLIITLAENLNEPLKSAAVNDEKNLTTLFEQLGFIVISKPNLTAKEIDQTISDTFKRTDLRHPDSVFVIISGPGGPSAKHKELLIIGVDNVPITCANILSLFSTARCHSDLAGKPKIFICHTYGDELNEQTFSEATDGDSKLVVDNSATVHTKSRLKPTRNWDDMLVVSSTMSGHSSYQASGSWFVTKLCKVFMEHACNKHIEALLRLVDDGEIKLQANDFSPKHQTLVVENIGFNRLYFNPGL